MHLRIAHHRSTETIPRGGLPASCLYEVLKQSQNTYSMTLRRSISESSRVLAVHILNTHAILTVPNLWLISSLQAYQLSKFTMCLPPARTTC